jgi:hypothetical protein
MCRSLQSSAIFGPESLLESRFKVNLPTEMAEQQVAAMDYLEEHSIADLVENMTSQLIYYRPGMPVIAITLIRS